MSTRSPGDSLTILEAILSPLKGRRILDIGCGGGHLLRALADRGARVAGVDPDEEALALARKTAPAAFLQQAGAEQLPFGDGTVQAAIFLNSLHHVAVPQMSAALAEAARVVGRGGSVIVVEPLAEGTFFEALRPIEDETRVRLAAQQIIARILQAGGLIEADRLEYDRIEHFASVAGFIDRAVGADPARKEKALEEREKVMVRFDTLAERDARGYTLRQPLRLHHLRVPG
jgi:ubiquinone/menaquinone biosynthesis C-methylase UbiE